MKYALLFGIFVVSILAMKIFTASTVRAALLLVFVYLLPSASNALDMDTTRFVVETKQGKLRGADENGISVWRGIRYAKAPVGALRFRNPEPVESWKGIKDATAFGPIAPQIRRAAKKMSKPNDEKESEDCLFLNVWSPAADGKKRPVMFWIHGGGFLTGSGSGTLYDGTNLAKRGDVVVVTINYRLGALGFLYFKDLQGKDNNFENNLGIKDQITALKWVKENIAAFGGDPNQVTVFGESAGAVSVLTLMTLPSAKGLFNKAIVESGVPAGLWQAKTATEVTKRLLSTLKIPVSDLNKLRNTPVDTLNHALEAVMKQYYSEPSSVRTFWPTVDGDFIPTDLETAAANGKTNGIDLLIGTNNNEANLFALKRLNAVPTTTKQLDFYTNKLSPDKKKELLSAYKHYPHKSGILEIITDGIFAVPSMQFAASHAAHNPTYMYRFDWYSAGLNLYGLKACHGLELPFVFGTFDTKFGKMVHILANGKTIHRISDQMQTAWLNFAHTGNPNNTGKADWPKYDATTRNTLIYNGKVKTVCDPNGTCRKVWDGVTIFE